MAIHLTVPLVVEVKVAVVVWDRGIDKPKSASNGVNESDIKILCLKKKSDLYSRRQRSDDKQFSNRRE